MKVMIDTNIIIYAQEAVEDPIETVVESHKKLFDE